MKADMASALNLHFATHHHVISRAEAIQLGLNADQIEYLRRSRRWTLIHRGVYAPAGIHLTPHALTRAACLAAGPGAVASHATAAWLWDLLIEPPATISVIKPRHGKGAKGGLEGIHVHRGTDLIASDRRTRSGVPVTSIPRTLCDLGEAVPGDVLNGAVDRAFARRLATQTELAKTIERLARKGRPGPARLRSSLEALGVIGAPHPSVLEAKVLRLLHAWGITPLKAEAIALGGTYRLDFLLAPKLALEVDGFTYHSSPAAKAADTQRRNRLIVAGYVILQTDWLEVTRHPDRLQATVLAALRQKQVV